MGQAKNEWIESQERGWDAPEKHICRECVADDYLQALIDGAVASTRCDYCDEEAETDIAAPVETIMPAVIGALTHSFADPAGAGVPYESAEGGWLVEPTDTADALMSIPLECHDALFEDVVSSIHNDAWVPAANGHWASEQKSRVLIGGWDRFAQHVKHRQRYFFTTVEPGIGQDIVPSSLLPALGDVVSDLSLLSQIPANTKLFRARFRSATDTWPMNAANLGAPPPDKAAAGRMNPPGISYLYLALEKSTAFAEIVRGPPCSIAIAQFCAARDLRILNLVDLPKVPSVFDHERLEERELLVFLRDFVEIISRPVAKDGAEHIEYVPSQVVCEYFATVFKHEGASLDGLLYPSAVRRGGRNVVLFPRDEFEDGFPIVKLKRSTRVTIDDWRAPNRRL